MVLKKVTEHPDMPPFRVHEVSLIYNFNDRDGAFLLSITISPTDYQ